MATLTGKIIDVTSRPPDSISSITVKAPAARIGGGGDVIVSSPATVDFSATTGDITISDLTGGLSWLYIEGDGWSDSIAFAVADGMITLVEAIANAAGAPGLVDYLQIINNIEQYAQDFVNSIQADTYGGFQDASVSADTLLAGGSNSNSRVYYRMASGGSTPDRGAGVLDVTNTGYQFTQTFYGTTNSAIYQRTITDRSHIVPDQWIYGDWKKVAWDDPAAMATGEARRSAVVEAGLKRRGGVVGTGGKPAIALRFDHHLAQFGTKVLPLLKQYRLPWGQMINAGNIGSGNDTWTWVNLATECHNSGGEVWNHSWSHSDVANREVAEREITQGLNDLRAGVPSLWVDSWAPPGQAEYLGFANQDSPEKFYDTVPGRMVLAQHAFVRGSYPGPHHPLNGQNLIGQSHATIDAQTAAWGEGAVRSARDTGSGLTLMLHSNYLDQAGYMTTSELEQVLAYIAQLRDAGEIVVLSNAGILMADSSAPIRQTNMLPNSAAGTITSSWSRAVTSRSYRAHLGVPTEAEVWVKGSGQVTLRVAVSSPTYPVTSEHTVTLGSAAQRLSTLVTPPLDTTGITVSLTGNVSHTGITYRPI